MHPMQVPPLPYRQPPQTEEATRYLERVRGLEFTVRELLVQKECLEKRFLELKSAEARALSEMHRSQQAELKTMQKLNDAIASEKRALCGLQYAQAEIRRYREALSDKLERPQSWANLVQENNSLKEEIQRLLYEQRRKPKDPVHSPAGMTPVTPGVSPSS